MAIDFETARTNVLAAIVRNAEGGIRAFTQGGVSYQMEDPEKLLSLYERLERITGASARRERHTYAEVVD